MINRNIVFSALIFIILFGCKKNEAVDLNTLSTQALSGVSNNVVYPSYKQLKEDAAKYVSAVDAFIINPTNQNLTIAKDAWRAMRATWEQCEGFLWGPVATSNFDPETDTWPVNYVDLEGVLQDTTTLTPTYISTLDEALKGYHPMEYLLWGKNGNKDATAFTTREKEYLKALSIQFNETVSALHNSYDINTSTSYLHHITKAGAGSTIYTTKRAAFEEIVNGIAGICDEVANGKMEEPFIAQDASLEESPFSNNSMTDFRNNIQSVENIYYGKFGNIQGAGITTFVRETNTSLDNKIKLKITIAKDALNAISVPFGQAIFSQPNQIVAAQNAINDLKNTLETELIPLIQQRVP